jgi:hypothetical protein
LKKLDIFKKNFILPLKNAGPHRAMRFFMGMLIVISALTVFLFPARGHGEDAADSNAEGAVRILTDTPDLKVYFNGEAEGLAHPDRPLLREYLPAGSLVISVRTGNNEKKSQTVNILPGKTQEVYFRFRAAPAPPLHEKKTSAPDTAKDRPIRTAEDLLRAGDKLFQRERYLLPKNENAFEMYKAVLMAEPENPHARAKIFEMIDIYKKMEKKTPEGDLEKRAYYLEKSFALMDYTVKQLKDSRWKKEYSETGTQLKELEMRLRQSGALCKEGDIYFIAQHYTTPADKNAFESYRAALEKNPGNDYARKRIREIAAFYKNRGDNSLEKGDTVNAESYYRQYLPVGQFIAADFGNRAERQEAEKISHWLLRKETRDNFLSKAGEYTQKGQIVSPEKENALYCYKEVLKNDPENAKARAGIQELLKDAYAKAGNAFESGKYEDAGKWGELYIKISDRIPGHQTDLLSGAEREDIRHLLRDVKQHLLAVNLRSLHSRMRDNYEAYRKLLEKEEKNENVSHEIIPLMKAIVRNLEQIEDIYLHFPEKIATEKTEGENTADIPEDMEEKMKRIRTLRAEMEQEVAIREGKIY